MIGLLFAVPALLSSCSTEIDVNAPNLDIPIIYCLLDTEADEQYLKLNKTYLLYEAAAENPPVSDSQYFEGNVQIVLERWENNKPVEIFEFFPTYDIPKKPGFFPTDKNLIYKANAEIKPSSQYMINIYLENKEKIVHAATETIGPLNVIDPMDLPARKISLNDGLNYSTRWQPVKNAGIYQVVLRFNYAETREGVRVEKFFDWPQSFTNPISNVDYLSKDISGTRFYYELAENIPVEENVVREALSVDFIILSGGQEIKFYIESTAPSAGALMEKPVYSNVVNGVGVFSSMATQKVEGLLLSTTTIDSIAHGRRTKELGFLDHNGQ